MTEFLKRRFIVTAMAAVTALLVVVIGAINLVNLTTQHRRTTQMLEELSRAGGVYTPPERPEGLPPRPALSDPSPDDMMGARYFTVELSAQGAGIHADLRHIFSVDEEEALEWAEEVSAGGRLSGDYGHFRFQVQEGPRGGKTIVFLDVSAQLRGMMAIGATSLLAGGACWLAMLLLVSLLSKRAIAPIAESMEKQKQFVTNAGHEIKTPLAIIQANTDALELHSGESKWSRNIRTQVARLDGLMKNLLILAKMDEVRGQVLPAADFSMTLLLEELLDQYRELAEAGGVTLEVNLEEGVMLHADRNSVSQLLSILLDNAIRYTPSGSAAAISLFKKERGVFFRTENPCAEPVEDPERLFDRFYRPDSARSRESGGYGIGLSAARAIAKASGGSVTARYGEGRIAFTVKL